MSKFNQAVIVKKKKLIKVKYQMQRIERKSLFKKKKNTSDTVVTFQISKNLYEYGHSCHVKIRCPNN